MTGAEAPTIAAGIVSFRPDAELLLTLVDTLSRDVGRHLPLQQCRARSSFGTGARRLPDPRRDRCREQPRHRRRAQFHRAGSEPRRLRASGAVRSGLAGLAGPRRPAVRRLRSAHRAAAQPRRDRAEAGHAARQRRLRRQPPSRRRATVPGAASRPTAASSRSTSCRRRAPCSTCDCFARPVCSGPIFSSTSSTSSGVSGPGAAACRAGWPATCRWSTRSARASSRSASGSPCRTSGRSGCTPTSAIRSSPFASGTCRLRWKIRQAIYLPLQMLGYARHHGFGRHVTRPLRSGLGDGFKGRLGVPPPETGF